MEKRIRILLSLFVISISLLCVKIFSISSKNPAKEALSGQYTRRFTAAAKSGGIYDRALMPLSYSDNQYITIINCNKTEASPARTAEIIAENSAEHLKNNSEYILQLKNMLLQNNVFSITTQKPLFTSWSESYVFKEDDTSYFLRHIIGYSRNGTLSGLYKYYNDTLEKMSGTLEIKYTSDANESIMPATVPTIYDKGYSDNSGIILTISKDIQTLCETVADKYMEAGSLIVTDSLSGEILSCVSRPVYDVNNLEESLSSEDGEFLNRAFLPYPAGSVFKIITAAAALENNIDYYNLEYNCTGCIEINNKSIRCHKTEGHGKITMKEAFAHSCNPYFIKLAAITGYDMIIEMAQRFGIGKQTTLDRFEVQKGNLPDTQYPSELLCANTAIGQGEILITPLEAANIINGAVTGYTKDFSIVKGYRQNKNIFYNPKKASRKVLDDIITEKLKEMLRECVTGGTGKRAFVNDTDAGGKTGTAQTGKFDKNNNEINHHWFIGTFPLQSPKYTIVILYDSLTSKENKGLPQDIFAEICKKLKYMK